MDEINKDELDEINKKKMDEIHHRKFDGPLQKPGMREPIKDPIMFKFHVTSIQRLLSSGLEAPGMSYGDLLLAAENKQHVEGVVYHKENYESALSICNILIEMEPLRAVPWTLKAQSLFGLGRFSEALEACERALEIDPSDPAKWGIKSQILMLMGEIKKSKQAKLRCDELRR